MWIGLLFAKRTESEVDGEEIVDLRNETYESKTTPRSNSDDEVSVSMLLVEISFQLRLMGRWFLKSEAPLRECELAGG